MPEYVYNDKTGLYYLASKVLSDKYYGAPLNTKEKEKMIMLENEYAREIDQARCILMMREDLKDLDYVYLLKYCADLILMFRLENAKAKQQLVR